MTRLEDPFQSPIEDDDDDPELDYFEIRAMPVLWESQADKDNARDATEYLAMFKRNKNAARIILDLRNGKLVTFKAKDILRASRLDPVPVDNEHVRIALDLIAQGIPLTPVYLLRGKLKQGVPVVIADGYHRVSAAYWTSPSTKVSAYIARP